MSEKTRIIRAPRDSSNPYFMARRLTAQDSRLSFEARGVLMYLLSKHDDWQIQLGDLMREGACGRDRIKRIIRELEKYGYLRRNQPQDDLGKFAQSEYWLYEAPLTENPLTVNPSTDQPLTENPAHTYKENPTDRESVQNTLVPPAPPAGSRSEQAPAELAPTAQDSGGEVVEEQPTAQAPPPPKSKRPRKPQQLKTLADLTPMQRTIAVNAFAVREGQGITDRNMIRINLVVSEITHRFGLNGDTVTPDELQRAYTWKRRQPRNSVIPKDGPKTGDMVQDHRDATGYGHRPTLPPALAMSDEDYARTIQRQILGGEVVS